MVEEPEVIKNRQKFIDDIVLGMIITGTPNMAPTEDEIVENLANVGSVLLTDKEGRLELKDIQNKYRKQSNNLYITELQDLVDSWEEDATLPMISLPSGVKIILVVRNNIGGYHTITLG